MTELKQGQKVRVLFARNGYNAEEGDVLTIIRPTPDGDGDMAAEDANGKWRYISPEQVEAVGPQWSDVEAFDKVTFRIRHLDPVGDETRMAYDVDGTPNVLGVSTRSLLIERIWELLSIEKPKPQPPTTPGSHVTVPFSTPSRVNHLFLLDSGKWASQTGLAFWPAEDVASKDFTVVHDAGATS